MTSKEGGWYESHDSSTKPSQFTTERETSFNATFTPLFYTFTHLYCIYMASGTVTGFGVSEVLKWQLHKEEISDGLRRDRMREVVRNLRQPGH